MHRGTPSSFLCQLSMIMLSVFFAVGGVSISYDQCLMGMASAETHTMAEMENCDMEMPVQNQKQCCADFSCPKCFSTPLYSTKQQQEVSPWQLLAEAVFSSVAGLSSYHPAGLERPPKIV